MKVPFPFNATISHQEVQFHINEFIAKRNPDLMKARLVRQPNAKLGDAGEDPRVAAVEVRVAEEARVEDPR